ncbi:MAG: hypothetical protein NVS2B7_22000 [Herpetosiphon sp.]
MPLKGYPPLPYHERPDSLAVQYRPNDLALTGTTPVVALVALETAVYKLLYAVPGGVMSLRDSLD